MTTVPTPPGAPRSSASVPSRPVRLIASGPEQTRDQLLRMLGARLQVTGPAASGWQLSMDGVDTGLCSSTDVVLPAHLRYVVGGPGDQEATVIGTVTAGRIEFERQRPTPQRGRLDRYRTGDTYVGHQPGALAAATTHQVRAKVVTLSRAVLAEAAEQVSGRHADDRPPSARSLPFPAFTTMAPSGLDAARQWRRTTRYVDDTLADPVVRRSALLVAAVGRLLATTALTVFPNPVDAATTAEDRHDAHPDTLRRAVAFIEAHPDLDITLADIARAVHVSPRTVQLAFRRHLGTTPLAHLRTVRMDQAHRQLQEASPEDGTTVAAVAARWGLTPSRFTQRYRAVHGVLPSDTLRS